MYFQDSTSDKTFVDFESVLRLYFIRLFVHRPWRSILSLLLLHAFITASESFVTTKMMHDSLALSIPNFCFPERIFYVLELMLLYFILPLVLFKKVLKTPLLSTVTRILPFYAVLILLQYAMIYVVPFHAFKKELQTASDVTPEVNCTPENFKIKIYHIGLIVTTWLFTFTKGMKNIFMLAFFTR